MQLNPPQQSPSTSLSTESFLVQQPPPTLPFPPKNHLSTCLLVSCKMQVGYQLTIIQFPFSGH